MNNYVPLFSHVVDSSLWDEEAHVTKVFLTMLSLKDFDHVVRWSAHHLSNKSKVGDDLFLEAIKVLEAPDSKTKIPQEFEGRRIEKVEGGWLILNGAKYQEEMRKANEKARWARNKREQRARESARKYGKVPEMSDFERLARIKANNERANKVARQIDPNYECEKQQEEARKEERDYRNEYPNDNPDAIF